MNNKDDYYKAGLKILTHSGERNLTIDTIIKSLSVSKGSFYHHFRNRRDFSIKLISYWEKMMTLNIIDLSTNEGSFEEKNKTLLKLSEITNPALEVAIRAWALRDDEVKEFQERVDNSRQEYLVELYSMKTDRKSAEKLAKLRYTFYIGCQQIIPRMSENDYIDLSKTLQDMFTLSF